MLIELSKFFREYHQKERPVLLAFSGGPDSLALLHLLLEYRQKHPLNFALAHVDHGWREESGAEAQQIGDMAKQLGVPFHLKKLQPAEMKMKNLEAACREERLLFFSALCRQYEYQAVLLGHHADDLAETVLKRTFEGVTLPYLAALRSEITLHGMKVWRPLLPFTKSTILAWLEKRGLQGFMDKTNQDTRFMRARMRLDILPQLSEIFGKQVSSGLCQIAEEAGELRDYLDEKMGGYVDRMSIAGKRYELDLREDCPNHLFELKYLIRQFCKRADFSLSRECVEKAAVFVLGRAFHKSFLTKKGELHINKRQLTITLS
jgi:tRNA(Ile)-lysidine synthase